MISKTRSAILLLPNCIVACHILAKGKRNSIHMNIVVCVGSAKDKGTYASENS